LNRLNVQATQNTHRYHRYFNRIAGIVFISTPHGSSSNLEALSESCIFLVKQYATGKLGSQTRAILKETISSSKGPLMIARRFDDIHIGVEVLSVYETLPTKRKTDYPWQKQKHFTVGITVSQNIELT
jgi:hypothetical protein